MSILTALTIALLAKIANAANPDGYADVYVTNVITVSSSVTNTEIETSTLTVTDPGITNYNTVSVNETMNIIVTDSTTETLEYTSIIQFLTCTTSTIESFYTVTEMYTETVGETEIVYETNTPETIITTTTTDAYYSTYTTLDYETTTSTDMISIVTCTPAHEIQTSLLLIQLSQYQVTEKSTYSKNFKNCFQGICNPPSPSLFGFLYTNSVDVASMRFTHVNSIYSSWTTTFSQYQSAELAAVSSGFGSSQMLSILTTYTSRMLAAWSSWTQSQIITLDALNPTGSSILLGNTRYNSVSHLTNTVWPSQYSVLTSILSDQSTSFTNFLSVNSTLF